MCSSRPRIATLPAVLQNAGNQSITAQASPFFRSLLDILVDLGFAYDSSVFPFAYHKRYGRIGAALFEPLAPGTYRHRNTGLLEFLLPMRSLGGLSLPWAGGGYFRLLPAALYRRGVRDVLDRQQAFVFYMHPWEIDPGQPRAQGITVGARFRHYVGLKSAYRKLEQLLGEFGGTLRLIDLAERVRSAHPATA